MGNGAGKQTGLGKTKELKMRKTKKRKDMKDLENFIEIIFFF